MSGDPAFWLTHDEERLGEDEYDARLVPFENSNMVVDFIQPFQFPLPQTITFEDANLKALQTIDYPLTDVRWPIMSKRMREVLASVGPISWRDIPVVMRNGDQVNASFAAIEITKHTDAFDWERSKYERHHAFPDRVGLVRKLVLRDDVPLPPLFRLTARPAALLVSAAARAALDAAHISGVSYESLMFVK